MAQSRDRVAEFHFAISAAFDARDHDKAEELAAEAAGLGAAANKGPIDRMRRRHFADLE